MRPAPPPNTNAPPATRSSHRTKQSQKQSSSATPPSSKGYRVAYDDYERNDYAAAIEQLKALGDDDHPNVANLIGYSYRKLGDYEFSQVCTSARRRPIRTTYSRGSITASGKLNGATAIRRNII